MKETKYATYLDREEKSDADGGLRDNVIIGVPRIRVVSTYLLYTTCSTDRLCKYRTSSTLTSTLHFAKFTNLQPSISRVAAISVFIRISPPVAIVHHRHVKSPSYSKRLKPLPCLNHRKSHSCTGCLKQMLTHYFDWM